MYPTSAETTVSNTTILTTFVVAKEGIHEKITGKEEWKNINIENQKSVDIDIEGRTDWARLKMNKETRMRKNDKEANKEKKKKRRRGRGKCIRKETEERKTRNRRKTKEKWLEYKNEIG